LPLFIVMGELLFRTQLSRKLFGGLAPWGALLPGRLIHVNVVGCSIFAAISGSSAGDDAGGGPHLARRADTARLLKTSHRQPGRRRYPGIFDPALEHHDYLRRLGRRVGAQAVHRRLIPGFLLAGCFMAWG